MKKMPVIVSLVAVTLAGCSTKTESKPAASASSAAGSVASTLAVPDKPTGPHTTINDYVDQNKIVEKPVTKGEPGAPVIHFAMPPDWKPAGARKPEWAYGAIIYDKAKDPADPPFITAIYSKLTGDVDPAKVLEYAPGMLQNLPGYEQDGELKKNKVGAGNFDSVGFQASYLLDNVRRYIAQRTIVIPRDGAVFVLQLNADAPLGQDGVVHEAADFIRDNTTITV